MGERWIQSSKRILDYIRKLENVKEKDRLEYVSSIHFMLSALQRSILGWMQWVNNPEIMNRFTEEDLKEMNKRLLEFTRSFIEYDIEVTKKGEERGLKIKRRIESGRRRGNFLYLIFLWHFQICYYIN